VKETKSNYKVVCCEGGDQVGKADAILTFTKKMMELGVNVTYGSFPIYATPIGVCIRLFLRQGLPESNISEKEALKIKMALYALNRLEFMDILLSHPQYKDTLILLDRSPYSNAVTIAYGVTNSPKLKGKEQIDSLIDYAFELESFMRRKLNTKNCVVQMVSEDRSWNNVRNEKADINENESVQKASDEIYQMYAKRIGAGWKEIVTKKKEGWRGREEIFNDIYNFSVERLGKIRSAEKGIVSVINEIGIAEILKSMYRGCVLPEGLVTQHLKSLRENDKDMMHDTACIIGVEIGQSCKLVVVKHKAVREAMLKILDDNPGVYDVLKYFISDAFVDKLKKGLDGQETASKTITRRSR
jgi:thymidylate kinase